jgi:PleD family two-component response regulator
MLSPMAMISGSSLRPVDHAFPQSRVIVADPDAATRASYGDFLRVMRFDVIEAEDGRDALAKSLVRPPGAVITELRLPFIDGYALCEILRRDRMTRAVPVIVVTGETRERELSRARSVGASEILVKPVEPEMIRTRLIDLMNRLPEPELVPFSEARLRRTARVRERLRADVPLRAAPQLVCQKCGVPLRFDTSFGGGVRRDEQWDYFTCGCCGQFEYRHRTRKLRQVG